MQKSFYALAVLAVSATYLGAQPAVPERRGDVKLAQADEGRCRREVREYIDALRFVRQSAGNEVGNRVSGSYVSEAELQRIEASAGACVAAKLLREKGAPR